MSRTESATPRPVETSVVVRGGRDDVFRRFTREMGRWWPLRTHSVGGEEAASVGFEEHVEGRVFERTGDGTEHDWGRVLVWDPPRRFVMSWHPGQDPATAQEVEVRFTAAEDGRTRLDLVHRGWERMGAKAEEARRSYEPGWDFVLGRFVAASG